MTGNHEPAPDAVALRGRIEAVVVGGSAGAVDALSVLLPALPRGCALPLIVVVHLPPDRESLLAGLFRAKCRVDVKEAEDKEPILGGTVYFAPPGYHLLVEPDRRLSLSVEEPVLYSRPSIDVLFASAVDAYGSALLGIVLTGANHDGARGLRQVCDGGGVAFVQRRDTAQAQAMPAAAYAACPGACELGLDEMAAFLQALTHERTR